MANSTLDAHPLKVLDVAVSEEALSVKLSDGRTLSAPTGWYPRFAHATDRERRNWKIIDGGRGIHWGDLDEDLSLEGILAGRASAEGRASLTEWLNKRSG